MLTNPENLWLYIKDFIIRARDISTQTFKASSEQHPRWYTPEIRHLLKKLKTLNKLIRRNPTWARYAKLSELESNLQNLCTEAKGEYEISLVESFSLQPKQLYSQLSRLKSLPSICKVKGNELFDDMAKANASLTLPFQTAASRFHQYLTYQHPQPTRFHEISFYSLEVYEAVRKLDTSKAMGTDNLHPHLLKMCALMIHKSVTTLFNSIIQTQIIPEEWKVHKVIPIPKKGDLTLVQNYHPISLS